MKVITASSAEFGKICRRNLRKSRRIIQERVRRILDDVRLNGDDALIKYTKKFDRVSLAPAQIKVSETEISGSYQNISPNFIATLKKVFENVNCFYKKQVERPWKIKCADGVMLGDRVRPLERVGVYVPSGQAPLLSTVYMTVLPARIAGVKEIVMASPPNQYKGINPHILVVAGLLKVDAVYKAGGAQAIAAMAYGTKTIPKVDKIVGPGNQYVTEAKRQVFGDTDIDMLAGPSELVIIANNFTPAHYVIADLQSQIEHLNGLGILVTSSRKLAETVNKEVKSGYIIMVDNVQQAAEAVNKIAPEHLQIMIKNPREALKKIENAGAIFIGLYSPTAVGDYVAGPSHVLPTGGTARFFSGLRAADFLKHSHVVTYSKKALEDAKDALEKIAGLEGMVKHIESVRARFN